MPITRPVNLQVPFASTGSKNTIPVTSQIGIIPGAASFTDGFPPLTMTPIAAGGVPPSGMDMNGVLNALSQHTTFLNAGGMYRFDAALSTAIGGYPVGFVLQDDAGLNSYVNTLANNTTNFNTTSASIGVSWIFYAGTAPTGPTPAQFDNTTKLATSAFVRNELLGLGGSAYASIFGASLATNGWRKLPNGDIEQWGLASYTVGVTKVLTFPIAFPNAAYSFTGITYADNVSDFTARGLSLVSMGLSSVTFNPTGAATTTPSIFWRAIGK